MFLENATLTWYGDNVDGGSHRNCEWSFEEVVIGLYDRFIHQGALRSASDAFQSATYIPEEGVMAFYHRMTRYAASCHTKIGKKERLKECVVIFKGM